MHRRRRDVAEYVRSVGAQLRRDDRDRGEPVQRLGARVAVEFCCPRYEYAGYESDQPAAVDRGAELVVAECRCLRGAASDQAELIERVAGETESGGERRVRHAASTPRRAARFHSATIELDVEPPAHPFPSRLLNSISRKEIGEREARPRGQIRSDTRREANCTASHTVANGGAYARSISARSSTVISPHSAAATVSIRLPDCAPPTI